ncbi:MAG: PqqD family protein [Clostridia bacterium]|nr:PqqD family protein [Clostridia bacterium]
MKLNETYQLEQIAGRQVLLPQGQAVIDGGMVYQLNDTAAWVLGALRDAPDEATLLRRAAEEFLPASPAEQATLETEIRAFCDTLRKLRLLED